MYERACGRGLGLRGGYEPEISHQTSAQSVYTNHNRPTSEKHSPTFLPLPSRCAKAPPPRSAVSFFDAPPSLPGPRAVVYATPGATREAGWAKAMPGERALAPPPPGTIGGDTNPSLPLSHPTPLTPLPQSGGEGVGVRLTVGGISPPPHQEG